MGKIVTTDQEQVDKYETDRSKSNITDFNNPMDDDEYPLSSVKKSIAIYKSRIDKILQILGSKVRLTVYLIRKQNKQDSSGEVQIAKDQEDQWFL